MKHYRAPLYDNLYRQLKEHNITLKVVYSAPNITHNTKRDNVELPRAYGQKIRSFQFCNGKIVVQLPLCDMAKADLIIVEQANKHVVNYILILLSTLKIKKIAFWGHGFDHQNPTITLSSKIKRYMLPRVDWWFAYTSQVAKYVSKCGFSPQRITNLENAIDSRKFHELVNSVSNTELESIKREFGIFPNARVCLYCGSMYKEKEIKFLVNSLRIYRQNGGDAFIFFIGAGPDESLVEGFVNEDSKSSYLGPLFGRDKARFFALSDLMINPGLIGLGILDAFAAKLPVITTNVNFHSPEIEYLENGVNGILTEHNEHDFAENIDLILHSDQLNTFKYNAENSGRYYSIERMATNMCEGICNALAE